MFHSYLISNYNFRKFTSLKKLLFALFLFLKSSITFSQENNEITIDHSLSLNYGAAVILNPNLVGETFGISSFQSLMGNRKQSFGIRGQLYKVKVPDIETKLLVSASAQYNYLTHKRFHGAVFLGINYQNSKLAYPNYTFDSNGLTETGNKSHLFGPILGTNVALKVLSKKKYSIDLFLDYTRVKLNKSYKPSPFNGYKSIFSIGLTLNKSKP